MVRPSRQPAPEPTFPPILPKPPAFHLPQPNPASANASLINHQAVSINAPSISTTSGVHRTVPNSGQHRSGPNTQPLTGTRKRKVSKDGTERKVRRRHGDFDNNSVSEFDVPLGEPPTAPRPLDTVPHPSQRRPETHPQLFAGEPGGGFPAVVPNWDVTIRIVTQWGQVQDDIASFDKTYLATYIDRRSVQRFNLAEEPCKAEYRWTPGGSKLCQRMAVLTCTFPNFKCAFPNCKGLEISHTPKQVKMFIIEGDVGTILLFGKGFQDAMEAGVYGDNRIHTWHLVPPDVALHHNMQQPSQEQLYVQGSQPVPHNPQSTARASVVDFGTSENLANMF